MKRLLLACLAIVLFTSGALAETVSVDYTFEHPTIDQVRIEGEEFDIVLMPNAANCGKIGEPSLPGYPARILLPYGTEVENVTITYRDKEDLGGGYYIKPVPRQYKLSQMPTDAGPPIPNKDIYSVDEVFPASRFESVGVQKYRGYSVLNLKLQPVEYYPVSGDLYYYPEMTVVIETKAATKSTDMYRGFAKDEEGIRQKVDNPDATDSYLLAPKSGAKSYDLLIITTTALAASFEPLKNYHDTTGILTEIHTTNDIGSTSPSDVRDYIRNEYMTEGIEYVIIGADDDIIPAVDLWVEMSPGGESESAMPCDMYFGCLDGTYNNDGDSRWGEPTDGDGGGDVDMVAEVAIGRAAVGNTTEADRFVNKTLTYIFASGTYLQDVIMVGEHLGFGGVAEYANNYLDELIDGSTNHGYTTVGIPSTVFNVDKLYDYDWAGNNWPKSELIARINEGRHIINHLGHGSPDYAMKLYDSDVSASINNTDLSFLISQTCLAGHLDGTDCWAEYMNIKIDGGCFALIMNARYGFGEFSSTDGASERYNREFWDAVFNPTEGITQLGPANHDSKEDNLYRINDDYMRWCCYEINLFGDPTVSFRGVEGLAFNYAGDVPETVYPGQATLIEVAVEGVGDGVPVSGTGELHYSVNGGGFLTVMMTEVLSNEYEAYLPALLCGDTLEFYVSAEEVANGTFYDIDPGNPHVAIPATGIITVFDDDFETDKGWDVSEGEWARGIPTGGGGDHGSPDPTSGYTDPNVLGYNLSGDYSNSMPEYHTTSPAFDCSGLSDVKLSFWRYLGVEQPSYDHAYIRISTDGSNWTTIWENGGTIEDNSWNEVEYDISAYADGQSTVYLRFTQGISDGSWSYCGWNIDDLEVIGLECAEIGLTVSTPDLPEWTVDFPYSQQLEAINGMGLLTWGDKFGDLAGSGLSLSSSGLISGTPTTVGDITFTAEVTDEAMETAEKSFTVSINSVVSITTTSLPEWTAMHSYTAQVSASGGTGAISLSDKYGDLVGSGLSLASDGGVTGIPSTGGTISFTAEAIDAIGSNDEQALDIIINDVLLITTETLPTARISSSYNAQLECTGGTGSKGWSEMGANLSGYGLMLMTSGQVSGTPSTTGIVNFAARVMDGIGASTTKELALIISDNLTIMTSSLPDWTVGIPYSQQVMNSGGIGTITWIDKNNDLVGTGLTLSPSGLLSGTPASEQSITFTAEVSDEDSQSDEREFTFTINALPVITTTTLPDWTAAVPYNQQLVVSGGTAIQTWSDKNGDLAGTGLVLGTTGILSGTPSTMGMVSFTALVTDAAGATDEQELSFTINTGIIITTPSPLPAGEEGEVYSSQLEATGGTSAKSWSDKNGDLAETGLTLSSEGLIAGTPVVYGDVTFIALVGDLVGATAEKTFVITVTQALVISTVDVPDWTILIAYSHQLTAAGGSGAKSWADKDNDLTGTGLSLSAEGLLSGTPILQGEVSFTAQVADDKSTIEKPFTLMINPSVSITTESLPEGKLDSLYTFQMDATGGTGAKTWQDKNSVLAGYGLTLSAGGLISGTATAGGLVEFIVSVSDVCGCTTEEPFSIDIKLPYICGDANGDETVNVGDAIFLVTYVFKAGPAPDPLEAGDANASGAVDIGDAVHIVNFIFNGGVAPVCP